jgi:hypothetical protein
VIDRRAWRFVGAVSRAMGGPDVATVGDGVVVRTELDELRT